MSRPTQDPAKSLRNFAYGALTLSGLSFQIILLSLQVLYRSPTTPTGKPAGLGSFLFARRYLGNRFFFLFLQLLRCFSSLRLPSLTLTVNDNTSRYWVPPFGYLRIIAYLLLPEAFRGSSRPSSASSAKAFTMRPFPLDLFQVEFLSLLGRSSICFFDCLGFLLLIIFSFQCTSS